MYILLTNDDGIGFPGLNALVKATLQRGHRVMVCAPAEQQSATSQRINLNTPIMARQSHIYDGAEAWAVSGTPADCVRIAFEISADQPDVCISGINDGENAGCAVFYSGTVAAAREAAMHGVPAFAVSILPGANEAMLDALASYTLDMAERSELARFPRLSVVNINAPAIPANEWKGTRYCTVSQAFYHDTYERRVSPRGQEYFWIRSGLPMDEPEPGTDYHLLHQGYVTISVLGGFTEFNSRADQFLPPQET